MSLRLRLYFWNSKKGKTIEVFPTAQLHQRNALAYIIRMCYFYGNIKLNLAFWIDRSRKFCIFVWLAKRRRKGGGRGGRGKTDLSTWENCYLWDFDHNSIQNIITLGDAVENCYLPHNFLKDWPNKLNITTDVVLPWIYSAITKIKYI